MGGFILPFGRFMNNVVAFSYAWSPTVLLPDMGAMFRGQKVDAVEALSKATVGTTALFLSMDFQ